MITIKYYSAFNYVIKPSIIITITTFNYVVDVCHRSKILQRYFYTQVRLKLHITWILSNSSETLYLRDPAPLSQSRSINTICKIREIYHVYIHNTQNSTACTIVIGYMCTIGAGRTYVCMRMHIIHRVTFRTVAGPYLTNRNDSYQSSSRRIAPPHACVFTHILAYACR